jgi:hypothetical protein
MQIGNLLKYTGIWMHVKESTHSVLTLTTVLLFKKQTRF